MLEARKAAPTGPDMAQSFIEGLPAKDYLRTQSERDWKLECPPTRSFGANFST
jgi:hypothetical protein